MKCAFGILAVALLLAGCGSAASPSAVAPTSVAPPATHPVKLSPLRYSSRTVSLANVSFANAQCGWAVGDAGDKHGDPDGSFDGAVLRTRDGGATWKAQRIAKLGIPGAVTFVNAKDGWMVGGTATLGTILATTDGGATWVEQHPDAPGCSFADVAFADAEHGWVVGIHDGGAAPLFVTTDGGATWTKRHAPGEGGGLISVFFVNAKQGWVADAGSDIYATTDGGVSWKKQYSSATLSVGAPVFANARDGWAVGTDSTWGNATILATTDGGASWAVQLNRAYPHNVFGGLGAVVAVDARHAWAVGRNGLILATSNGGVTWSKQKSATTADLYSVSFTDAWHGWAVGETDDGNGNFVSSTILATTDGGATWMKQK
jgi:photosystem II stability/assembly factor-like uncharacterized protein